MGDRLPPGGIASPHVHREALAKDQQRRRIDIHLMNAPIYQQIARHAESDQQVEAREEEIVVEQVVKASKGANVWHPATRLIQFTTHDRVRAFISDSGAS